MVLRNDTKTPGGPAPFSSLGGVRLDSKMTNIEFYHGGDIEALPGLTAYHDDSMNGR